MHNKNHKSLVGIISIIIFSVLIPTIVQARSIIEIPVNDLSSFRQYKNVQDIDIVVPTVVEIPIEELYLERLDFVVVDQATNQYLPYKYLKNSLVKDIPYSVTTSPSLGTARLMIDGNSSTYTEFNLDSNDQGTTTININSATPITSSAFVVLLDKNISLPTSVEITVRVNTIQKKILAKTRMTEQTIRFPETTSSSWRITFTYSQILRINELRVVQENQETISSQSLRFLAQPNKNYKVYFNPDRPVTTRTSEAGNLTSNDGVLLLSKVISLSNSMYKQADIDNDGLPDITDNCVLISNADQEDIDGNGRGDACDDFDRDGIINSKDNCINDPNKNQRDEDGDDIGDACDDAESRITEKHKWLPWVGIGTALVVIVVLFIITATSKEVQNKDKDNTD